MKKFILAGGAIAAAIAAVIALVVSLILSTPTRTPPISFLSAARGGIPQRLPVSVHGARSPARWAVAAAPCCAQRSYVLGRHRQPLREDPETQCMDQDQDQILRTECIRVNSQPASLQTCAYDIAGLLDGSASAPAPSLRGTADTQPLGELVSVDMQADGLQGQSLDLSWSIFPQNQTRHLSRKWLQSYKATA